MAQRLPGVTRARPHQVRPADSSASSRGRACRHSSSNDYAAVRAGCPCVRACTRPPVRFPHTFQIRLTGSRDHRPPLTSGGSSMPHRSRSVRGRSRPRRRSARLRLVAAPAKSPRNWRRDAGVAAPWDRHTRCRQEAGPVRRRGPGARRRAVLGSSPTPSSRVVRVAAAPNATSGRPAECLCAERSRLSSPVTPTSWDVMRPEPRGHLPFARSPSVHATAAPRSPAAPSALRRRPARTEAAGEVEVLAARRTTTGSPQRQPPLAPLGAGNEPAECVWTAIYIFRGSPGAADGVRVPGPPNGT